MSTKLSTARLRRVLLGIGVSLFVAAAIWIATFPVSFSV
jgi:hypothetical protein